MNPQAFTPSEMPLTDLHYRPRPRLPLHLLLRRPPPWMLFSPISTRQCLCRPMRWQQPSSKSRQSVRMRRTGHLMKQKECDEKTGSRVPKGSVKCATPKAARVRSSEKIASIRRRQQGRAAAAAAAVTVAAVAAATLTKVLISCILLKFTSTPKNYPRGSGKDESKLK